jgi:hypothetical protein
MFSHLFYLPLKSSASQTLDLVTVGLNFVLLFYFSNLKPPIAFYCLQSNALQHLVALLLYAHSNPMVHLSYPPAWNVFTFSNLPTFSPFESQGS